ncbi:MAG: hypothetical protein HY682_07595 [Chloroflexi bacterium]|nr:hypothetical protein [Chloroflexota bacterium]
MSDEYLGELNQRLHVLEEQRPVISDLKNRLARLERAVDMMRQLEHEVADVKEHEALNAGSKPLLPEQVTELLRHLDSDSLSGLRRHFTCTHCGARGRLAVRVKCTNCDTNSWIGWWAHSHPKPEHARRPANVEPAPTRPGEPARQLRADL